MSARIIYFPSNIASPAIVTFYGFSQETQGVENKDNSSVFQTDKDYSDKEYKDFDEIIEDQELAKEMFPPDYFMLVE